MPPKWLQSKKAAIVRSLKRNDVDLCALQQVQRKLQSCKPEMDPVALMEVASDNNPNTSKDTSKDNSQFQLLLKLRRRLLNRLVRRLHRVAATLDGESAEPPLPLPQRFPTNTPTEPQWERLAAYNQAKLDILKQTTENNGGVKEEEELSAEAANVVKTEEAAKTADTANVVKTEEAAKTAEAANDKTEEEPKVTETSEATPMDTTSEDAPKKEPEEKPTTEETPSANPKTSDVPEPTSVDSNKDILLDYYWPYDKTTDKDGKTSYVHLPIDPERFARIDAHEVNRWQTALLARIPEQPSFDSVTPKVFYLQERLAAAEKQTEPEDPESKSPKKRKKEEENEPEDEIVKSAKPISLAPVPSFYDQDLRRIRSAHSELVSTFLHSTTRKHLEAAVNEYNHALNNSVQLERNRLKARNQFQFYLAQRKLDYPREYNMAQQQYLERRRQFDAKKLAKLKPSYWGRPAHGTQMTKMCSLRPDPIAQAVGACMADVIEIVDLVSQGRLVIPKFPERFVPPSNNTMELQQDVKLWDIKVSRAEEHRHKCWRKLAKLQNRRDTGLPPLHQSSMQNLPPVAPTTQRHGSATQAKRGPDGLFVRPAGRTRKGMEWDAFRGIWVPSQY